MLLRSEKLLLSASMFLRTRRGSASMPLRTRRGNLRLSVRPSVPKVLLFCYFGVCFCKVCLFNFSHSLHLSTHTLRALPFFISLMALENNTLLLKTIGQPVESVPRFQDLGDALFAQLCSPIELPLKFLLEVPCALKESFVRFEMQGRDFDTTVTHQCQRAEMPSQVRSEDAWSPYHGQYIFELLELLMAGTCRGDFRICRNQAPHGTLSLVEGTKRPDFTLHNGAGVLLMHGEEKASSGELGTASDELKEKLREWNVLYMGELPFLFCYAAGADLLQFFVLDPQMVLHSLHEQPINVSTVGGALQMTVAVINIFRIFQTIERLAPKLGFPKLFSKLSRHDCDITFEPDYVAKVYHTTRPSKLDKFQNASRGPFNSSDLERLDTLFCRLVELSPRPDCLEVPTDIPVSDTRIVRGAPPERAKIEVEFLEVHMTPVGIQRPPNTKQEVQHLLCDVLRALVILHKLGYVHCDVRWPNIITAPLAGQPMGACWCLIDFGETKLISDTIKPQRDLVQLAVMLTSTDRPSVLGRVDFPINRFCKLLRVPDATAAGVLQEATAAQWVLGRN